MKKFLKSIFGKITVSVLALVLISAIGLGVWVAVNAKFQDVTIELGEKPDMLAFYTKYAIASMVEPLTREQDMDLTRAGDIPVSFQHGLQQETVYLHIVDTTAPTAAFQDVRASILDTLKPEDFVTEYFDLSPVTFSFSQPLTLPDNYADAAVEVVVTDASGNEIRQVCRIYYTWLKDAVTVELGTPLTAGDLLLNPEKDAELIQQADLDTVNQGGVGEYTIVSSAGGLSHSCTVTVQDTTGPELILKSCTIYTGNKVKLEDFLENVTDISGVKEVRLMTELDNKTVGEHKILVEAEDTYGNITSQETVLKVIRDGSAPTFTGVNTLTLEKNAQVDFSKGVAAYDTMDGYVKFTYDDSKVDLSKAGTYYVTYTAYDSVGNKATYRRKIVVNHDEADRQALIQSIADRIGDHPLQVRQWCLNNINYHSNQSGGSDPVWYGLSTRMGNCVVHANCLKALLDAKGYETRLMWTTCKTHFWVLIYYEGSWKHIDSTPGLSHDDILLVNDDVRYAHLQGRDWDRSLWPAAE